MHKYGDRHTRHTNTLVSTQTHVQSEADSRKIEFSKTREGRDGAGEVFQVVVEEVQIL